MSDLGLGFEYLNTDEQYAYHIFKDAMLNQQSSCDISRIKRNVDTLKVLQTVLGDNPQIIYFNKTTIRTIGGLFGKQLGFTGCLNKKQAMTCDMQLKKALEDAVWEIDKKARNDAEILQGITEFLQRNVKYDFEERNAVNKSKHPMSHNAYGALVTHLAVCDGIASAFSLIAQYFGMRCMIVEGKSSYSTGSKVQHAWNIVEYMHRYYHVDATWDTNTYEGIQTYSYDYFGLDDDEISIDHDWDYRSTPKCDSNQLSYFYINKLLASSEAQIVEILKQSMKRNEDAVRLKVSAGIALPEDYQSYFVKALKDASSKAGKSKASNFTWNERTRCLIVKFK